MYFSYVVMYFSYISILLFFFLIQGRNLYVQGDFKWPCQNNILEIF